jgi:hypothetical protein
MKTVRRSTKKGDQHWHPVAQRRIKHFAAAEIWRRLAVILQVTDHINNDVSTIDINNDIRCHRTGDNFIRAILVEQRGINMRVQIPQPEPGFYVDKNNYTISVFFSATHRYAKVWVVQLDAGV